MLIYLIQGLASICMLVKNRNNFIHYMADITVFYFISYFFAGSFDVSLSLYVLFLIAGIGKLKKINFTEIVAGVWLLVYTVVGIVHQDAYMTIASVVTRYAYIIVYICVVCAEEIRVVKETEAADYRYFVRTGLITEALIVIMVWLRDGIGARIVTNHQPVGGGIALGITLIVGICYRKKWFTATEMIVYDFLSMILIILSGTRGYMVIFALVMAVTGLLYLMDIPDTGKKMMIRVGMVLIVIALGILWICVLDHGKTIGTMLRLDESLGYRENENLYVRELLKRVPWIRKLFGFGFGKSAAGTREALAAASLACWNRKYMFGKLLERTIFHNYWYTVLFKQGISGLLMIMLFYAGMVKRIFENVRDVWIRYFLLMMVAGTMISLTFRITATCSVLEILLIGYVIRIAEEDTAEKDTVEKDTVKKDTEEGEKTHAEQFKKY